MGPIPQLEGVRVISVMMLLDPIKRIKSAYRFERQQDADTWGAKLAKEHDFEGYVRARLAQKGDRQCRNFQTFRLASVAPSEETELKRARLALAAISAFGPIDDFPGTLSKLAMLFLGRTKVFDSTNVDVGRRKSAMTGNEVSAPLWILLREDNEDDLALLAKDNPANR